MDTFFGGKVATRQDTQITLTDLPGLDDEEKQDLYQKHMEDNWMQYDCVVVVLDVGQAHNAKNILNFVNNNCKSCANSGIPVIILINKVDSPKNTTLQGQVAEICRKVEEVFQVKDRETALNAAMEGAQPDYPLVIPVSAQNAFLYLHAKNMSKEMFKKLPLDMIEEVGSAECGAFNWQEATTEQKYTMAYEKLSLEKLNRKRLDETNFETFLEILSMTICGAEAQGRLINNKIDATLKSLNASKNNLIAVLRDVYDKKTKLGQPTESLADCFWSSYKVLQEQTFKELEVKGPSQVYLLAELVDNLLKFHDFADPLWDGQHQIIKDKMKNIVVFQMKLLGSKFLARGLKEEPWALEASQWNNIFHCVSVNFGDRVFSEHFQNYKFDMEDLIDSFSVSSNSRSNREAIINSASDGRAELPQSFKDPHHWGYVAWRFCQFAETLKM
jgi:predicted GTPase